MPTNNGKGYQHSNSRVGSVRVRMFKKTAGEAAASEDARRTLFRYVECPSAARTKPEVFFNIRRGDDAR